MTFGSPSPLTKGSDIMPLGSHYSIMFTYLADGDPGEFITKFSHIMIKPDHPLETMSKEEFAVFLGKVLTSFVPLPAQRKYMFGDITTPDDMIFKFKPIFIDVLNTFTHEEYELGVLYIQELKSYNRDFDFVVSASAGIDTRVKSRAVIYEADSAIPDSLKSRR